MNENPGKTVTGGQNTEERMFTQTQVNEMMRKRVERSHNSFFQRYGVKDLDELDERFKLIGSYESMKAAYDELTGKYGDLDTQHQALTKQYAYKVGNINPEKYSDIETYFKGKNIAINEESLMKELKLHPEWAMKPNTVVNLGSENMPVTNQDEMALASQIFGVDLIK